MAIHLLRPSGISPGYGVLHAELGINVSNFSVKFFPEVNVPLPDAVGNTRYRVMSQFFSRTLECQGEVTGTTGIMAFALATACTFANRVDWYGPVYGTFYLDEATVTQMRSGWVGVRMKATAIATL